jgi:hypothetical protein
MNANSKAPEVNSLTEFLESIAPSRKVQIQISSLAATSVTLGFGFQFRVNVPRIRLHCEVCDGIMYYEMVRPVHLASEQIIHISPKEITDLHLGFKCCNCDNSEKTISLFFEPGGNDTSLLIYKYGEYPPFGAPTPNKLLSIIGADRDLFIKGRRVELQGLGIGAFSYYRRVVENQKNRIIDEIIKVAKKSNASLELITELEAAKKETQFTKAIDMIKHGIPQALLINGHNPLTLLHRALSEGLHDQTDEECLELARTIRLVMAELSERLSEALKNDAELNDALSRLLNPPKRLRSRSKT